MTVLLEYFYDRIFVFWKNLSKPIGLVDLLRCVQRDLAFRHVAREKFRCRLDICAHVQLRCNLPCDGDVIAGNHFDFHSISASPGNGALRIGARRIEQRQNSQENPIIDAVSDSDTDGAGTVTREIVHRLLRFEQIGTRKFRHRQEYLRCTFANVKDCTRRILDCCFGAFVYRIEGNIGFLLITLEDRLVFQSRQYCKIDRIVIGCA